MEFILRIFRASQIRSLVRRDLGQEIYLNREQKKIFRIGDPQKNLHTLMDVPKLLHRLISGR